MKQNGFTLIELMVTIAILGILASIAIPAYQDYTVRARVTEGLNLAAAAKLAVSETVMTTNQLPENQTVTGYESPVATENVSSVVIDKGGVIVVTYTPKAGDGTLVLTPALQAHGEITWACKDGTLASKYRPAICR